MGNVITIEIDKVSFQLQEEHDLLWLKNLGEVFCVFDQQDSGNISFGVEKNDKKFFVKYAGAKPMDFSGDPKEAVDRLIKAVPVYKALKHPNLISLIDHFSINNGYTAIFEWFDGECLHSHWSFGGMAKYTNPDSPFYRFKNLDIEKRLETLDTIFSFHTYAESQGFVAVDFYDGSILYDFKNHLTKICDIDFYRKSPSINDIGDQFWGAARSKSPEEFNLGSPIDSKTNVFTMGSIAFGLLGGEMVHSISKWEADKTLYEVAIKAVQKDRDQRYSTVKEFYEAWRAALK
ncbi:serine/threonine-protein kinase [Gracilibacillus alcaliphilus]|uniref:serine/threonine-protein kinase n=1 Tax=Gracilibacillus alcaliphilus TaxID=1401441 RepID=UPI00195CFCD6|nr:serine/threonine-protein kinase [Gracilibacillus alcaliphilus]MBM7677843.1 serine/threonine-protein kinase [Gracilibacillus alcaliphilus]